MHTLEAASCGERWERRCGQKDTGINRHVRGRRDSDSLKDFTLPLLIGFAAGGYSSIFLAAFLWGSCRKLPKRKA